MPVRKIAVIYHGDCIDGFAAALAAWKKFGNKAEYYGVSHSDKPLALKGKTVYFLDLIYEDEKALARLKKENKVIALDHHVSTKKLVESMDEHVYAEKNSGAVIAWKYFHPAKGVPRLYRHIEDYDLWRMALPQTQQIVAWLKRQPLDMKAWTKLVRDFERAPFRKKAVAQGELLYSHFNTLADRIIAESAEPVKFMGYAVYAVNAPSIFSDVVGHKLYEKHPPFTIIWRRFKDVLKVSLRGNGNVDLTKLAGRFGGGGHHDAAGFSLSPKQALPWKSLKS